MTGGGARNILFWIATAAALVAPNTMIVQKERLRATGEPVLLELAPVDPRSLIQGDYMALSYAVERDLRSVPDLPPDGRVVLALDARGVGRFARIDDGRRPLGARERLLRYRVRGERLKLGAEAFFFQEGAAERYARARYGELRVAPDGTSLLADLCDADREPLSFTPPR